MERRLIDANALKECLENHYCKDACDRMGIRCGGCLILAIEDAIDSAPTIDAVEVVRCKDCVKFWQYSEEHKATVENADGDCAIRKWRSDDEQFCAVTKDDYCSCGVRREHDGE